MYHGLLKLGFNQEDFMLQDDGEGAYIREWYSDKPQPSAEEIQTAEDAHEAEYISNKYQRDRKAEYPPMPDQLDYIFHHGVEKWKEDMIIPVKNKYPKE